MGDIADEFTHFYHLPFEECINRDLGDVLLTLLPLGKIVDALRENGFTGREYESCVCRSFLYYLNKWGNASTDTWTDADIFWLVYVTMRVGIDQLIWGPAMRRTIERDFEILAGNVRNLFPGMDPKEFAALILAPSLKLEPSDKSRLPPEHPHWRVRGVHNVTEWRRLGSERQTIRSYDNMDAVVREFLKELERAFERKGLSEKAEYVADFSGIEPLSYDEFPYMNDEDRMSQFCELVGVDMTNLTEADSRRILTLLNALDAGYSFASKQGMSIGAYYGDQAEAEKKPRQRLFTKIRQMRDKAK